MVRRSALVLTIIAAIVGIFVAFGGSIRADAAPPTATSTPAPPFHGISVGKGCISPTTTGATYMCNVLTLNNLDTAHDTLRVTSIKDTVHAFPSDVTSGELLPTLSLTLSGGAFCNGLQTVCTLPYGGSIQTSAPYGFYTTDSNDPSPLGDTITVTWEDLCDAGGGGTATPANCPLTTLTATAGSSTILQTPTPTPTNTPTNTPTYTPTNTATKTATPTPTVGQNTATPVGTVTPPTMDKIPQGNANNVITTGPLPTANLFLCDSGPCAGDNENKLVFIERAFTPSSPLGAFEFQIKFDHKIFDIGLECTTPADPDPGCTLADTASWDIQLSQQLLNDPLRHWSMDQCFRNVTENYINFACTSTGPTDKGYTGVVDLAVVTVHPDADLKFRLTPGNDNGVIRVILDENCELADPLGHPVIGSIAGGLTVTCGDVAITVRILEGDLNLDCIVDLVDAQRIAQLYGMVFGLFLYDPWYDLEPNIRDFDIDAKDLQKVFGRIDSTCQVPKPPQPPLLPPQV